MGADRAGSVRVFAPADHARRRVLRWATRHAARTGGSVQVLVDGRGHPDDGGHPRNIPGLLVRTARDLAGRVLGPLRPPMATALVRELVGAVAGARMLVVPQSLPELPEVVGTMSEPVVAVPDRELPSAHGDVVLALAPWTGGEVVGAAFETAARYGADLQVVRALEPAGDAAEAARTCEDDLAVWRLALPEVTVDLEVVGSDPTEALTRRAREAQLVVMGPPARGGARGLLDPSPGSELLRTSPCPVLVVPPPGAPRPMWSARSG